MQKQDSGPTQVELRALTASDLSRSGLTTKDIDTVPTPRNVTKKLVDINAASYKIVYPAIDGKDTGYYRLRLLEDEALAEGSFGKGNRKQIKPLRYIQPKGTGCRFYYSKLISWQEVANDPNIPIFMTEGEKKAAKACKSGYPTIGLGGVHSFTEDKELIKDFNNFIWKGRIVYIVYDSDQRNNVNVQHAQVRLAKALLDLGAMPKIIVLPAGPYDKKQGLDDFLVVKDSASKVEELMDSAIVLAEAEAMVQFNQEFGVVREMGCVVEQSTGMLFSTNVFLTLVTANRQHYKVSFRTTKKGEMVEDKKLIPTGPEWIKWPCRTEFNTVVYAPGKPKIEDTCYNSWRPSEVQMMYEATKQASKKKKPDVRLFNRFMEFLMQTEPEHARWLMQWIAYPLQYPGTKLNTAVLFRSTSTGVGKSLLGKIIGRLYGHNFGIVTSDQIFRPFNQWAVNKQFILGDEVSGSDRRHDTDYLKNLITNTRTEINMKGIRQFTVEDSINYYFTSNHVDALYIEPHDRRFFVVDLDSIELPDDSLYKELDEWYKSDRVVDLYRHLVDEIATSDFNPQGKAPVTQSKTEMIHYSKSHTEQLVDQLKFSPDLLSQWGKLEGDLLTATDISMRYNARYPNDQKTSPVAVGRALRKAGYPQLRLLNYGMKLYVMNNSDKWLKATPKEALDHYMDTVLKPKINNKEEAQNSKIAGTNVVKKAAKKKATKR